ncbi:MAG: UbiA family prenyltransferase [Nitrospiraceae bacterium]
MSDQETEDQMISSGRHGSRGGYVGTGRFSGPIEGSDVTPARGLYRAGETTFGMRYFYLTFAPLWERFLLGEGLLLLVNAAIIWFARPGIYTGVIALVLSVTVLAILYSFNDLHDAEHDRNNPKKNQRLVSAFLQHNHTFYFYIAAVKLGLVLLAYFLVDAWTAAAVLSVVVINLIYSLWLKGVPIVDILMVGAWGSAYSAVASPAWRICLLVGIMTSVTHIFQILSDYDADTTSRVRTTAVFSAWATTAMFAAACAALFLVLAAELGPAWALTAFVPLALHLGPISNGSAWWVSRIYFGLVLIVILGGFSGHTG